MQALTLNYKCNLPKRLSPTLPCWERASRVWQLVSSHDTVKNVDHVLVHGITRVACDHTLLYSYI